MGGFCIYIKPSRLRPGETNIYAKATDTVKGRRLLNKIARLIEKRSQMLREGVDVTNVNRLIRECERSYSAYLVEDTSATGGPGGAVTGSAVGSYGVAMGNASTSGMGAVLSPQPSSLAGSTTGPAYSSGGGMDGSGDIGFPFPAGGGKRMYQKAEMGKSHGPRTGKKGRVKKMDMKRLRDALSRKQDYTVGSERKLPRVMNWQDFQKRDIERVKKVKY